MKTWRKWKLLVSLVTIQLVFAFLIPDVTGVNNGDSMKGESVSTHIKGKGFRKGMSTKKDTKPSKTTKILNGKSLFNPSMAIMMLQDSEEWYTWKSIGAALVINDQCLVSWASIFYVDALAIPLQLNFDDPAAYTAYFPRENCDRAYHGKELYLSNPMFSEPASYNDISLFRLANKIEIGEPICGQSPIYPTPISCDRKGPPVGYKDCYIIGWGATNASQVQAAPNIVPTEVQVETISFADCERARNEQGVIPERAMDPNTEICTHTLGRRDAMCNYDSSAPLICKYWNPVSHNNNGWGWNQNSNGNGWNSNSQTEPRWVVVGQTNVQYDYTCSGTTFSADRITLFGAPLYVSLFSNCNLVCSNELQPGYECKEKWDKGLGPVYCTPQKIQQPQSSNGWRRRQ